MTVWDHARKGKITGVIVGPTDGEWVDILLTEDQQVGYVSQYIDRDGVTGEVLTVRRSFLTEIET